MGKRSAKVPAAPDPVQTADAQYRYEKKAAQFGLDNSRVTTQNPYGSSSWTNTPSFDQAGFDQAMAAYAPGGGVAPNRDDFTQNKWTNNLSLNPENQGIYDTATAGLQDATSRINPDADAYNSQVADAIYSRMRRYQDPADAEARSTMQSNLADRGFQVGNEGFNSEMTRLDDSQGRGRADAADNAVIQGMTQGRAQQSMQQQIAQALQGIQAGQYGGIQGIPGAATTPSVNAPDYTGLVNNQYTQQVNAANAKNAGNNSVLGSLLSLGGMAFGSPWLGAALGAGASALGGGAGGGANPAQGLRAPPDFYNSIKKY